MAGEEKSKKSTGQASESCGELIFKAVAVIVLLGILRLVIPNPGPEPTKQPPSAASFADSSNSTAASQVPPTPQPTPPPTETPIEIPTLSPEAVAAATAAVVKSEEEYLDALAKWVRTWERGIRDTNKALGEYADDPSLLFSEPWNDSLLLVLSRVKKPYDDVWDFSREVPSKWKSVDELSKNVASSLRRYAEHLETWRYNGKEDELKKASEDQKVGLSYLSTVKDVLVEQGRYLEP
jgi:hypothetical protein